jgi:hypothetical protein
MPAAQTEPLPPVLILKLFYIKDIEIVSMRTYRCAVVSLLLANGIW